MDEDDEDHVKLVKSGEDATEAFEATKLPLDFISSPVHLAIVFPWIKAVALGWNNRNKAQVKQQAAVSRRLRRLYP